MSKSTDGFEGFSANTRELFGLPRYTSAQDDFITRAQNYDKKDRWTGLTGREMDKFLAKQGDKQGVSKKSTDGFEGFSANTRELFGLPRYTSAQDDFISRAQNYDKKDRWTGLTGREMDKFLSKKEDKKGGKKTNKRNKMNKRNKTNKRNKKNKKNKTNKK